MIRIDAMWLAVDPVDMRAGADRLIASVVQVFGTAQAHHGYLFANARGTRMKLVVHDGFGVWCATRRLNQGRFAWPSDGAPLQQPTLTQAQLNALIVGLHRIYELPPHRWSQSADASGPNGNGQMHTSMQRSFHAGEISLKMLSKTRRPMPGSA